MLLLVTAAEKEIEMVRKNKYLPFSLTFKVCAALLCSRLALI
jgi:hypothetical protein